MHILISNCAGFINTFANSVGLERWGYKYYFVFVVWNVCASALWFLFCVETRGRTLEELDATFNEKWPAMASARPRAVRVRVVREGEGGEVVKVRVCVSGRYVDNVYADCCVRSSRKRREVLRGGRAHAYPRFFGFRFRDVQAHMYH